MEKCYGIINRTGEKSFNNFGSKVEIVVYRNVNDIDVYFEEYDYIVQHLSYSNFKKGRVACPYERKTYGKGYMGVGDYKSKENKKLTDSYDKWVGMLRRCYSDKLKEKHPTYIGCSVCDEWLNYQNFAKWYEDNYYKIDGQRMELDKDILYKGNKIYSPETCVFVPRIINTVILNRQRDRGKYPVGVTYSKRQNMFIARCSDGLGQMTLIGRFNNSKDAFTAYKTYKENFIKNVADEYKNKIPNKLYEAMYRYQVEMTD